MGDKWGMDAHPQAFQEVISEAHSGRKGDDAEVKDNIDVYCLLQMGFFFNFIHFCKLGGRAELCTFLVFKIKLDLPPDIIRVNEFMEICQNGLLRGFQYYAC